MWYLHAPSHLHTLKTCVHTKLPCQISANVHTNIMVLLCRGLGPWGPNLVRKYTSARFGSYATGELLNEDESKLLTGNFIYKICFNQASIQVTL